MTTTDRLSVALADRYRIERELGRGGMATVYLAHDVRHDRDVAIKVLHEDLGATLGPERFLAEIKTTAKLQHPHILPLLDSGSVPAGHPDPERREGEGPSLLYYVMPFVAGETLRERLTRDTQLSIDDAVRLAREVADALGAAHAHGVVHRDIKPENILLQGGHALVADFGIALAVQQAGGQRMTQTGLSLGTPQYMAPEQAMGDRTVDHRADIYALGAVTYEMLTGDPPFTGSSLQAIVAKVVSAEPERPTLVRKTIPPAVEAAVLTALAKLPADRFASARDFAEALSRPVFTSGAAPSPLVAGARPWIVRGAAIALAAIAVSAAVWGWRGDRGAVPRDNMRVLIDFPDGRAPIFQPGGAFALSPDGSRLAYMGGGRRAGGSDTWRLWVRPLDRLMADSIPGSEEAHTPTWSPGGDSVAFVVGGDLRVFSTLSGGGVATIRRGDEIEYGLSWSRERGILFATASGLHRLDPSSGAVETLVRRPDGAPHFIWPFWVDGGGAVIFTAHDGRSGKTRVLLARLGDGVELDTLTDGFNGQPLPNGDLVWADATGSIFTAPLDVDRGRLSGGRTQLLAGVHVEPGMELRLSVSRDGAVVYAPGSAVQARSRLVVVNRRGGERTAVTSPSGVRFFPDLRLSRDGVRLAVSGSSGVNHQIWVYHVATSQFEPFTLDGIANSVAWAPNGDQVTYCSSTPSSGVFSRPADKRSPAVRLAPPIGCPRSWTPDGKTLLLDGESGTKTLTPPDTVAHPLPGGGRSDFGATVSPDGRWLAYAAATSGTTDVWVRGFRTPGGPWQVSQGGGFDPVWSRDGRSLFFRTDSAIIATDVSPGDSFRPGSLKRVTAAGSSVSAIYGQSFDVFPDGERLVLFESGNGASVEHLVLETNLLSRTRQR